MPLAYILLMKKQVLGIMKCVFNQLLIQSGTEMFFLEYFVPFIQWNWVKFCVKFPHYIKKKGYGRNIFYWNDLFEQHIVGKNIRWPSVFLRNIGNHVADYFLFYSSNCKVHMMGKFEKLTQTSAYSTTFYYYQLQDIISFSKRLSNKFIKSTGYKSEHPH